MAEEAKVEPQETEELESVLEGLGDGKTEDGKAGGKEDDGKAEKTEDKDGEKGEGEGEDKGPNPVEVLREEVKDLRQMLRTSKRELTQTQAKLERLGERPAALKNEDNEDIDEDGNEVDKKGKKEKGEHLSVVEELQGAIAQIGATRGPSLDILLETMEQNSQYKDIREVCSRGNFDDIFETIAAEATKGSGSLDEALLEVELSVWNRPNPYKYMYGLIKKYHPGYAEKEGVAGPGDDKDKGKDKKLVKAPGTIADKGGDSNIKSGWTAKRIDDLPEDELGTVPKETYDKYMRDELD